MEEKSNAKKGSGKSRPGLIRELMSGSLLSDRIILKNIGYILFLTLLGAVYIANRFHAEDLVRRITKLQNEVTELRSDALSTSAELMQASRQSEVTRLIRERGLGLEELTEPPYRLVVKK
ncbi:MAG: FtsL-like putative cell division protein [Bacteroidales bacterium]